MMRWIVLLNRTRQTVNKFATALWHQQKKPLDYSKGFYRNRRDGGIRTHDLQHPMLARYRATLHPDKLYYSNNLPEFSSGRDIGIRCFPKILPDSKYKTVTPILIK